MLIGFLSNGQNQLRKIIFEIILYKLNTKLESRLRFLKFRTVRVATDKAIRLIDIKFSCFNLMYSYDVDVGHDTLALEMEIYY